MNKKVYAQEMVWPLMRDGWLDDESNNGSGRHMFCDYDAATNMAQIKPQYLRGMAAVLNATELGYDYGPVYWNRFSTMTPEQVQHHLGSSYAKPAWDELANKVPPTMRGTLRVALDSYWQVSPLRVGDRCIMAGSLF